MENHPEERQLEWDDQLREWTADLAAEGLRHLADPLERGDPPPELWPGVFCARDTHDGRYVASLDPTTEARWLCVDPNAPVRCARLHDAGMYGMIPFGRHILDRATLLIHALDFARLQVAREYADHLRSSSPPSLMPGRLYRGWAGDAPASGTDTPLWSGGRLQALHVAARQFIRSSAQFDRVLAGETPALARLVLNRGDIADPEGDLHFAPTECLAEARQLFGDAVVTHLIKRAHGVTVPSDKLEPRLRRALIAIASAPEPLSPLELGRAEFGDGISDHECRENAKQWKMRLTKHGYPITPDRYQLEWDKLDPTIERSLRAEIDGE